jgi:DNA-binding transcriptional regulator YiaG
MSETFFTRKRGAPSRLSDKERVRLKNVSDAEAEARASKDPDNPPLNEEQLKRMVLAREVRLIREKTGLSQPQFAARFHIGLARLRDFEQARSEPQPRGINRRPLSYITARTSPGDMSVRASL